MEYYLRGSKYFIFTLHQQQNALKLLIFTSWNELRYIFNVILYIYILKIEMMHSSFLLTYSHITKLFATWPFVHKKSLEITKKKYVLNCLEEFQKSKRKRKFHFFDNNFTCFTVKIQNWLRTPFENWFRLYSIFSKNVLWYKIFDKWISNKLNLNRIDT